MLNFSFKNPTNLVFGKNTISSIGNYVKEYNLKKVLLLYGKGSIFNNGVYDDVTSSLKKNHIEFVELSGVKPNPLLSKVKEGINIVKEHSLDAIIAVGGGSVIDSGKAISAGSCYDGDVWDLFENNVKLTSALPLFTVLTLSATGSEMNCGGVITNEKENKKWSFGSPLLYPKVSILDPTIQSSLPVNQTINGAIDTITHVFEAYFGGTKNTDMSDELSEGIIRTVIHHSKILLQNPTNYESRCELAFAATLALNGLNGLGRKGDWASHNIEHSLSVLNDVSHGTGLAIIMPAWMKYVYKEDIDKFAKMGRNIFAITEGSTEEIALKSIDALKNYYSELGAPTTLKAINVSHKDLDFIADNASMLAPLGTFKKLYREDIYNILEIAFE